MVKKKPLAITAVKAIQLLAKREEKLCGAFVEDVLSTISYRIERNIQVSGEAIAVLKPSDDDKLRVVVNSPSASRVLYAAILEAGYEIKFAYHENHPDDKVDLSKIVTELNETYCDPAIVIPMYAKYMTQLTISLPKGAIDDTQEEHDTTEKPPKKGKKD